MSAIVAATTRDHIEDARALFNEYAAGLNFSLCFEGFDQELAGLPGKYGPPSGRLLLAYEDGKAVGCVALRQIAPAVCEMKRLYVKPSERGRGVGRRLVERLLAEARAIGYSHVRLDSTEEMKTAQALYRSMGFYSIEKYNEEHIRHTVWMEFDLRGSRAGAATSP